MSETADSRCPCCGGTVEHYPDQDGACDWSCARCGWSQHVPGSADIVAAMTLHPEDQPQTGEQTDKHVCDNCGHTFLAEDLQPIERLEERIEPGGTVPSGQCPDCGALCYPEAVGRQPDAGRKPTAVVFVEGGLVQCVEGNPSVRVIVCDFDTDGSDANVFIGGRPCFFSTWDPPDDPGAQFAEALKVAAESASDTSEQTE